ncbi:hypothetical protein PAXINDRAFT_19947 [Paxillus involutus ATCC 200175]|uniref:Unplaced genomic scaffold PAXINscaffold_806, whole genome shotgun sequence n=1 Tax=Paxillus involutus ATCC 200175 TaxID=664439 RepID=A0A0C9SMV8_PAXIN|nr:hypothetical protein PAXINDRAFT_19947 [Paxillus involutus ATCC 200175]
MLSKKRKLSGLTGMELRVAYNSLLKLKKAIVYEESEEEEDPDAPSPESFEEQVDTMLSLLGSKLEGPQSLTFSSMTMEDLAKLKIQFTGFINLKPNVTICRPPPIFFLFLSSSSVFLRTLTHHWLDPMSIFTYGVMFSSWSVRNHELFI